MAPPYFFLQGDGMAGKKDEQKPEDQKPEVQPEPEVVAAAEPDPTAYVFVAKCDNCEFQSQPTTKEAADNAKIRHEGNPGHKVAVSVAD